MSSRLKILFVAPSTVLVAIACAPAGLKPTPPPGGSVASITVTSKAFSGNGPIPVDNSCDGKDESPPITWSAPPAGTRSLAIVLDDPDASGGEFTHWIVFNIKPDASTLAAGADPATLGARLGTNDAPDVRYMGPCPPRGELHRYVFHVFALDQPLDLAEGANRTAIDTAMNRHVLGEGILVGMFGH